MRRYVLVAAVTAAAAALTGLAPAGSVPAGAAGPATRAAGGQLWVARYSGPANRDDSGASAMAVSPDGATVFVTGQSWGGREVGFEYATVAYSAATGRQLWASRYRRPGSGRDTAYAVAVSPDGRRVFVTGSALTKYMTVAYDAATGRRLWVSVYQVFDSVAFSVAVSPDGAAVFVTGESDGEYATIAYDAATGSQLWASRYSPGGTAAPSPMPWR